jgi:hypothetical protein
MEISINIMEKPKSNLDKQIQIKAGVQRLAVVPPKGDISKLKDLRKPI